MSLHIEVKKVPFFPAPRKDQAIWTLNPCYCSTKSNKMLISRVRIDNHGYGIKDWMEVIDRLQRLISYDNGAHWKEQGQEEQSGPYTTGRLRTSWNNFLDPETGYAISIFGKSVFSKEADARITKLYCEISKDEGETWSAPRQIIHPGKEYDAEHWMPGVTTGRQEINADQAPFAKLEDGTIVCGFTFCDPRSFIKEVRFAEGVVFLRARWNKDKSDLVWDIGDVITVPESVGNGVCEPDLVHLGGQRLFTTMRCEGNKKKGIFSSRQCALSEDGGKTWGSPRPLKYDDGTPVFVPASISAFEREPRTGKVYWFANILDKPVYGQIPRYTFSLAELDTKALCLKKPSVTVIRDFENNYDEDVATRYSNFGHYVDRATGEFVLTPEEEFHIIRNYQTEDYCCFRVRVVSE